MADEKNDAYLGDGVYASFDGYYIHLAVNRHTNKVVAIEPEVFNNLLQYAKIHFKTEEGKSKQS